jgi:hypothetical protein
MNEKLQPTPAQDQAMKEISKILMTLPTPGDALVVLSTLTGATLSMASEVVNETDAREALDLFTRATLMTWSTITNVDVHVENDLPPWPAEPAAEAVPYDSLDILLYRCRRCLEEAKLRTNEGNWPDERLAFLRTAIERFEAITNRLDDAGRAEVNYAITSGSIEGIDHLRAAFEEMGV